MTQWNLEETRNLVQSLYGEKQLATVRQSLGSTIDRRDYAKFHFEEAAKIFDDHISKFHSSGDAFVKIFGGNEEEESVHRQSINKIGAHITACVQSLHALTDTFGHAIYYALGCNLTSSLKPRDIYLKNVVKILNQTPMHQCLSSDLTQLISGGDYEYLSALANHGKHRSLIKTGFWLDMTGDDKEPYSLQFEEFTYDKLYQRRLIRPFLENEYNRQAAQIVNIGIKLNEILRAKSLSGYKLVVPD